MSRPTPASAPFRIAFCITDLHLGGAERNLVELVRRLDSREFSPAVYSLMPRPAGNEDALVRQLADADIETHFLDIRRRNQFFAAVARLRAHFRAARPDLVQTFLFHANVVGAMTAQREGLPVVAGIRVADSRSRFRLWLERRLTGNVTRYVCVSQDVREFAHSHGQLPEDKLVVIPNGVDVDLYQKATPVNLSSLGLAEDGRAVLLVGRLDRQKNVGLALRAFARAADRLPRHVLLIAGDGDERTALERQARALKISERVRFLGRRNDVPQLLAAADVLLLSSDWEGMPNVVLEAMAAGRPIVARDVEGVRELLGKYGQQQLVGMRDHADVARGELIDTFAQRIYELCGDESLARRLGSGNLDRARSFSYDAMTQSYQDLYKDILVRHLKPETQAKQ